MTGLVGFSYSSVSGVAPVMVSPPTANPAYVPLDDDAHPLAVTFSTSSTSDAFMVFFAFRGRYYGICNALTATTLRVEVKSPNRTLYFPAQEVAVSCYFTLSGAVLVTGIPADSYTARLWSDASADIFDDPRHLTVYRVQ